MNDHLPSEGRVVAMIAAYADLAPIDVDPMAMARLATAGPRRAPLVRMGFVPAGLWVVLLVIALLVSFVAGGLVAGGRPARLDPSAMLAEEALTPARVGPLAPAPEGAAPSMPETGELVLFYWGPNPAGWGRIRVWVYADGRLIWLPEGNPLREAAIAPWSRYFERRLTPAGVELMRSEVLAISGLDDQQPAAGIPVTGPRYLGLQVRYEGRLVDVARAGTSLTDLDRFEVRMSDPTSWLPASAWADRQIKAYVPSRYAVCYSYTSADVTSRLEPSRFVSLLPAPAADVLSGEDWTLVGTAPSDYCADVTTEEARALDETLKRTSFDRAPENVSMAQWSGPYSLYYEFYPPGPSKGSIDISFEPYLPHGETTCAGCG